MGHLAAGRHCLSWAFSGLLLGGLLACADGDLPVPGQRGSDSLDAQPVVAASAHVMPTCRDVPPGSRLLGVSPEGDAWLGTPSNDGMRVTVHGETASAAPEPLTLPRAVASAVVLGPRDGALVADGALWRLTDGDRTRTASPVDDLTGAAICGDPATHAGLLTGGAYFDAAGDRWRRVDVSHDATSIVRRAGACEGPDGATFLAGADTLWKLDAGTLTEVALGALPRQVGATARRLFLVSDHRVVVHDSGTLEQLETWDLGGRTARALATSTDALWLATEDALLRYHGRHWQVVPAGAVRSLSAHENGAWWLAEGQLCTVTLGSGIRVLATAPISQTSARELTLRVTTLSGSPVVARHAGAQVAATDPTGSDGEGPPVKLSVPLNLGWNSVTLSDGEGKRTLYAKRKAPDEVSWSADIEPLVDRHCRGCHVGADATPPELSTLASWQDNVERIRRVVVEHRTMPPVAARRIEWDANAVEAVARWLDGAQSP